MTDYSHYRVTPHVSHDGDVTCDVTCDVAYVQGDEVDLLLAVDLPLPAVLDAERSCVAAAQVVADAERICIEATR